MTRIQEIKDRVESFKHWFQVNPDQLTEYEESAGPDLEYLLKELETLQAIAEEMGESLIDLYNHCIMDFGYDDSDIESGDSSALGDAKLALKKYREWKQKESEEK